MSQVSCHVLPLIINTHCPTAVYHMALYPRLSKWNHNWSSSWSFQMIVSPRTAERGKRILNPYHPVCARRFILLIYWNIASLLSTHVHSLFWFIWRPSDECTSDMHDANVSLTAGCGVANYVFFELYAERPSWTPAKRHVPMCSCRPFLASEHPHLSSPSYPVIKLGDVKSTI